MVPLVVIIGPTASGKTDLAVRLAKKFRGEIVNADPWQMYIGLAIGVAKPKFKSKIPASPVGRSNLKSVKGIPIFRYKGVTHHLFDVTTPDKPITVQQWKRRAIDVITDIHERRKIPIMVGGTWLYITALVDNLMIPEVPAQPKLRKRLEETLRRGSGQGIKNYGLTTVVTQLLKKDPQAAEFVDLKNPRRVIRALEVIAVTKKPFSQQRKKGPQLFTTLQLGIKIPKKALEAKIRARAKDYLRQGLEREVGKLAKKYGWKTPALSAISYKEWQEYFEAGPPPGAPASAGRRRKILDAITLHTIQLAKRQMRWWKSDQRIRWVSSPVQTARIVHAFLAHQHES